jgi:hypothetical protein
MGVTYYPHLFVGDLGNLPANGSPGDVAGLQAVTELSITWGRSSMTELPRAATAALTVRDSSPGAVLARRTDLIGQTISLGWGRLADGTGGERGFNFQGRITDATAAPFRHPHDGTWLVSLAASSREVDLANVLVPAGTTWPAETFAARLARITALLPDAFSSVTLPTRFDLGTAANADGSDPTLGFPVAPADVSGADVLTLLRQFYASVSAMPMIYDPQQPGFRFLPVRRRVHTTSPVGTFIASLVRDPDRANRAAITCNGPGGMGVEARRIPSSGAVHSSLDTRITRIEVKYKDSANGYAAAVAVASTKHTALESVIGRRTWTVDTINASTLQARTVASYYAQVINLDASLPLLDSADITTAREPIHNDNEAQWLLGCAESNGTAFVNGSLLPQLGQRPLIGLLGGRLGYAHGQWTHRVQPALVATDTYGYPYAPIPVNVVDPGRTLTLADIDRSVTFADCRYLDMPAGASSGTPYPGNGL